MKKTLIEDALKKIENEGFCCIPNFLSQKEMDIFMPEVNDRFNRLSNNGAIGHVRAGTQKYLQHTLMTHKGVLDLYLNPFLIEIAEKFSQQPVHLQDYRIYQNLKGCKMRWHVDNKQTTLEGESKLLNHRGLIIIIYLSNSPHGSFQFVRKSHKWSSEKKMEDWESEEKNFYRDIVTFEENAGACIIYDTKGIHRAKPFMKGEPRTAFFAQYAPISSPTGEPIIIDTGMLKNLTDKQMQVLRFGRIASAKTWPIPHDYEQTSSFKSFVKNLIRQLYLK